MNKGYILLFSADRPPEDADVNETATDTMRYLPNVAARYHAVDVDPGTQFNRKRIQLQIYPEKWLDI